MDWFIFDISVLVVCAAVFSYLAILTKQPIIVAYIFCGILFGPWLLAWVKDIDFITAVSRLGITLLLFLAGIVLHPRHLARLFRRTSIVTLGGSAVSSRWPGDHPDVTSGWKNGGFWHRDSAPRANVGRNPVKRFWVPRLRAETRHFGVQVRACTWGSIFIGICLCLAF